MKKLISVLAISLFLVGTATVGVFAHQGDGRHMNGFGFSNSDYQEDGRHEHDEDCLNGEHAYYNNQNRGSYSMMGLNRGRMGTGTYNTCH